ILVSLRRIFATIGFALAGECHQSRLPMGGMTKLLHLRVNSASPPAGSDTTYRAGEGRRSMRGGSLANTERDLSKIVFSDAAVGIVMLGTLSEASALIRISYADKKIRITYTNSTAPVPKRLGFNAASVAVLVSDDRGGKIGDYLNAFASV